MEIKNYSKALECYEEVLTHILPDGELLFKIGQCYHFLGKIKIAQQFYQRSIKLDDLNDEVYFYLGECSAKLEDWNSAIHFYKRAIEIEGKREEYFSALATTYAHLDQSEKAFHYFDRAIELAPEQAIYWVKFAAFLMDVGAFDAAIDVLNDADEHAVGPELLFCKAACLLKMNMEKEAMHILTEALTEDFEMHPVLFSYIPALKADRKINAMIDFYQYER